MASTQKSSEETVKLITEGGFSIPGVGRRLSLASSTISYWVKAHKAGKLGEVGKTQRPLTEIEMELARTKRELGHNRQRKQARLGYLSPVAFEQKFYTEKLAA